MGIPIFLSNIAVQSSYSKQAMTLQILNRQNSLLNTFLNEIRNVELQNDRMRFRRMAYEISKTFSYVLQTIETPINPAEVNLPARDIVIATVLRAGLPFHQGFLNYFDRAESAFISARRAYNRTQETMEVSFDSVYTPRLDGKILLLVDPMLATGSSLVVAYKELLAQGGTPVHTHIASVIASRPGLEYVAKTLTGQSVSLWTAALDDKLTPKLYIDPGLGDAGDLAFGGKI